MPTSITMVRRIAFPNFPAFDNNELHNIAVNISAVVESPIRAKFSKISFVYCRKNVMASTISAGNAILLNTLFTLFAVSGRNFFSAIPNNIGTRKSITFCISSLPIGRLIPVPDCSDMKLAAMSMKNGIVKSVTMLLIAVRVTDRATSPFASIENTFDELPPGQQAISMSPIKYTGGSSSSHATQKAINGNTIICPNVPIKTARGLRATFSNAFLSSSVPKRNISTRRIGITIHTVFINSFFEFCFTGCVSSNLCYLRCKGSEF